MFVYIAYAEDTGSNEGERTLGVYAKPEDAAQAVETFDPLDSGEPVKWVVRHSFDQTHASGAVHVTRYSLEDSRWVALVIQYEVR